MPQNIVVTGKVHFFQKSSGNLKYFSTLNYPYYDCNNCDNKQNMNDSANMKCEKSDQPPNYEYNGYNVK